MSLTGLEKILKRVGIDRYILVLALTVVLATTAPARGTFVVVLGHATYWAIALLFFLYGSKAVNGGGCLWFC